MAEFFCKRLTMRSPAELTGVGGGRPGEPTLRCAGTDIGARGGRPPSLLPWGPGERQGPQGRDSGPMEPALDPAGLRTALGALCCAAPSRGWVRREASAPHRPVRAGSLD